jgi:glycosyltransferase involved in cell wall biosynthesis
MKVKKICAIAYTRYLTDPRVRRECEALAERGDQVDVFCLRGEGQPPVERVSGVTVYRLPVSKCRSDSQLAYIVSYFYFTLVAAWYITRHFLKERYQVIHAHNMPDFIVFAAIVPKLMGAKVILDIHDLMPETFTAKFNNTLLRRVVELEEYVCTRFADHLITVHTPYKQILLKRGHLEDRITVLMNLPDENIFSVDKSRNAPQPSDGDGVMLVYHGAIVERYGVDLALLAFHKIVPQAQRLRFRIIGNGALAPRVKQLIEELRLGERVEFINKYVPVDQLPALISRAHMGVVPNRRNAATEFILSTKLLEYVRLGIPALVSRLPTVESYFDETMVSYFEAGNVDDLAEKMLSLYQSPAARKALAENAMAFNARYAWNSMKQDLYHLVDYLTQRSKT